MKRAVKSDLIFGGFLTLFFCFIYILNVNLTFAEPGDIKTGVSYEKAKVVEILSDTCEQDPEFLQMKIGVQQIRFQIISGEYKGKEIITNNFVSRTTYKPAEVGTVMVLASYDGFITGSVENYSRGPVVIGVLLIFVGLVLFIGKMKGLKSLLSLGFTLVSILFLFIPLIIKGMNPIVAAVIVVILSSLITMYAINGYSKKTLVASVSCIACTVFAGLFALVVGEITSVSSFHTPEAEDLIFIAQNTPLQIHQLLFAGILFSSLGAIMDTAMSVTSALYEIRELTPGISKDTMFHSGMNIGKDIMGTMTNTLILAFVGSSINIFIIYYMYKMPYLQLVNLDLVIVEVIQGVSASIAVILAIPISAGFGAYVLTKK